MPCCGQARWKGEQFQDHKFEDVDVEDFVQKSILMRLRYSMVFVFALKSILVYLADLAILGLLFSQLFAAEKSNCEDPSTVQLFCNDPANRLSKLVVPPEIRPWIILASIMLSYVLLFIDWRKAVTIIHSQDISYAFTSTIANRYYVLRSYPHFCFFNAIKSQRRMIDRFAFFVFFAFKGWKRLTFAEFPRQLLNALSLADVIINYQRSVSKTGLKITSYTGNYGFDYFVSLVTQAFDQARRKSAPQFITYLLQSFTVLVWTISFLILLIAFFCYFPLFCQIRGNLKEYCCHKIDKRISQLLDKKRREDGNTDLTSLGSEPYDPHPPYEYNRNDYGSDYSDYSNHGSVPQVILPVASSYQQQTTFIPITGIVPGQLVPVTSQYQYTTRSSISDDMTPGRHVNSMQQLPTDRSSSPAPYLVPYDRSSSPAPYLVLPHTTAANYAGNNYAQSFTGSTGSFTQPQPYLIPQQQQPPVTNYQLPGSPAVSSSGYHRIPPPLLPSLQQNY